jgi:hypothetical protein
MYVDRFLQPSFSSDDERHDPGMPIVRVMGDDERDEMFPSGHRRSEYHSYGYTDEDIALWGLDQPGAPPPDAVWWAVVDLLDEMG